MAPRRSRAGSRAVLRMRGEHAGIEGRVGARPRRQRGESAERDLRAHGHVANAVAPRALQLHAHVCRARAASIGRARAAAAGRSGTGTRAGRAAWDVGGAGGGRAPAPRHRGRGRDGQDHPPRRVRRHAPARPRGDGAHLPRGGLAAALALDADPGAARQRPRGRVRRGGPRGRGHRAFPGLLAGHSRPARVGSTADGARARRPALVGFEPRGICARSSSRTAAWSSSWWRPRGPRSSASVRCRARRPMRPRRIARRWPSARCGRASRRCSCAQAAGAPDRARAQAQEAARLASEGGFTRMAELAARNRR